jgi:hypothetical protein
VPQVENRCCKVTGQKKRRIVVVVAVATRRRGVSNLFLLLPKTPTPREKKNENLSLK